jgi:hypothetical protein
VFLLDEPQPGRPDDITCIRCLQVKPSEDLDRLLWCEDCVARARLRALRIGLLGGAGLAVLVALYIWFGIQPDLSLIPAGLAGSSWWWPSTWGAGWPGSWPTASCGGRIVGRWRGRRSMTEARNAPPSD